MSDHAYRLLPMKRALARNDAELFGQRPRYVEVARRLAALLLFIAMLTSSMPDGAAGASPRCNAP
jgi:hypothetical protein